jgi:hypothetical protein
LSHFRTENRIPLFLKMLYHSDFSSIAASDLSALVLAAAMAAGIEDGVDDGAESFAAITAAATTGSAAVEAAGAGALASSFAFAGLWIAARSVRTPVDLSSTAAAAFCLFAAGV